MHPEGKSVEIVVTSARLGRACLQSRAFSKHGCRRETLVGSGRASGGYGACKSMPEEREAGGQREVARPNPYEDQDRGLPSALIFCCFSFLLRVYRVSAARLQQAVTLLSVAVPGKRWKGCSLAPYLNKCLGSDSAFVKL